jgi:ferredoxin, 2Fe-2S
VLTRRGCGIDGIVAECGGNARCATPSRVRSGQYADRLPPVTTVEDELRNCTAAERRAINRLSGQLSVRAVRISEDHE